MTIPKKVIFLKTRADNTLNDWLNKNYQNILVRGLTLTNIEVNCLKICQKYIGGSWSNASTTDDLTVRRISNAFTNQLYHVHLKESVSRIANTIYPNEPSDVVIKLYQEKHLKNYYENDGERLNDLVILSIMSQNDIGPKIYGIFADGFIQEYYKHEHSIVTQMKRPKLCRTVMGLLARINHLSVPITKESNLLFKKMGDMITFAYNNCQITQLANELNLKTLQQYNIKIEYEALMVQINKLNAPLVFSHNDFRASNLLLTEKDQIVVVDFEYSGYGSRGFDLACITFEWGRNQLFDLSNEPVDETILIEMLQVYIEECDKWIPDYSQKPENSLEKHLKEVHIMTLANILLFVVFLMVQQKSILHDLPLNRNKQIIFIFKLIKLILTILI